MAWYFKKDLRLKDDDEKAWCAYDHTCNNKINAAFNRGQKTMKVDDQYKINFEKMIQFRIEDEYRQRPVKRIDHVDPEGPKKKGKGKDDSNVKKRKSDLPPVSEPKTKKKKKPASVDLSEQQQKYYNPESVQYMQERPQKREQQKVATPQLGRWPVLGGYSKAEMTGMDNEPASEFDLGRDNAFSDFHVTIMNFQRALDVHVMTTAGAALTKKGFNVTFHARAEIKKFIRDLNSDKYDVAWIISDGQPFSHPEVVDAVLRFHKKGKGLMIWGDNSPLFVEANALLPRLASCYLTDDTPADRVLSYGKPTNPGEFDEDHLVFAGVTYLYEGVTICYPRECDPKADFTDVNKATPLPPNHERLLSKTGPPFVGELKTLATSSNGQPCISCKEKSAKGGRIIVDTGWTKLYDWLWTTTGQPRYVVNACVYLVDIEGRG